MKFKTDENLHIEVAERLRAAGYDAMTIVDQAMTDEPIAGDLWIADERRIRIRGA